MRVFIVLFAILAVPSGAASVSARSAALGWLQNHAGAPDELAALKGANPEAYAIVQALLTKRSLGLLNAKNPTASFSNPAPAQEPIERGPAAFANVAAPPSKVSWAAEPAAPPQPALPYANVKSTHHNWLNWKQPSSGADEAMVANVLGMVGGMQGAKAAPEVSAPMDAPAEAASPEPSAPKASSWGNMGSMLGVHKKVQHKDWLNWKPHSSDADQAMVANVLNMVGGSKGAEAAPEVSAPIDSPAEAAIPEFPPPVESAPKATSGWGDIGSMLGLHKKVQHKAAPAAVADPMSHYVSDSRPQEAAQMATPKTNPKDWTAVQKLKQNNDDKAVSSLLNMVAQLKGGKQAEKLLKKHHIASSDDNALSHDLADFGDTPEEAPTEIAAPVIAPAAVAEATPPAVATSSWGSIGGMLGMHEKPRHRVAPTERVAVATEVSATVVAAAAEAVPHEPAAPVAPHEDKDEKAVNSLLNMVAQLKGGNAAKLLRKHHAHAEDDVFSRDAAAFSAPAATPIGEASAPKSGDSWGDLGGMLGVKHKAAAIETAKPPTTVQTSPMGALPSEVAALVSDNDIPMRRAAPKAGKVNDYKAEANMKQKSDDTAVKSLLSMVAQLRGSKKAAKLAEKYGHSDTEETQDNPLTKDVASWNAAGAEAPVEETPVEVAPAVAAAPAAKFEEVPAAPAAPARKKNLFLDSLTSSLGIREKAHREVAARAKENSYLKKYGLESKSSERSAFGSSSSNKITASWFDDAPEEKPKPVSTHKAGKLLSWLEPEQHEQVAAVAAKPQAPTNPYLEDLS